MSYLGYLAEWTGVIRKLHGEGLKPGQIARKIYADGARAHHSRTDCVDEGTHVAALTGMIYYIARKKPHDHRKIAVWQTWTPEMQEAEFVAEYNRYSYR